MRRFLAIVLLLAPLQALAAAHIIAVTGNFYRPDGVTVPTGTVTFQLSASLRDAATGKSYPSVPKTVTLDGAGHISISLVANDDLEISPTGSTYLITERIDGKANVYNAVVPYSVAGGTVDLAALAPSSPSLTYGVSQAQLTAALAYAGTGFNVKSYGALGNGTTDDTAAIQSTINVAVSAGGGVVYFPHGTYLVSNANTNGIIFSVSSSNLIFRGEGRSVSIIKSAPAMASSHEVFRVTSASFDVFEDLGFSGSGANSSKAIRFETVTDCTVSRVRVDALYGWSAFVGGGSIRTIIRDFESLGTVSSHGIEINSSSYTLVDGCDVTFTTANGIEMYDQTGMPVGNTIRHCYIHGGNVAASPIQLYGTQDTLIEGNVLIGGGTAGLLASGSGVTSTNGGRGLVIKGNRISGTFSGASGGIYIVPNGSNFGPSDVVIQDNEVTGAAGAVIGINVSSVGAAMRAAVHDNIVTFNGGTGINVDGARAIISGNIVNNNSQTGVGLRNGISVGAGGATADPVVIGNECSDTQGTHTQQFGVFVGASATDAVVVGNKGYGTTSWSVFDSGTRTVTDMNRGDFAAASAITNKRVTANAFAPTVTVAYSASMTPNLLQGNTFSITATNGTAFTVNDATNPTIGERWTLIVKNTSGGALGAATFGTHYKMATFSPPATGNNRSIDFVYDGTNNIEVSRTPADVPN